MASGAFLLFLETKIQCSREAEPTYVLNVVRVVVAATNGGDNKLRPFTFYSYGQHT